MSIKAMKICIAIAEAGGTPYITGGAVRDILLGRPISDIDIEVFGIEQAMLEEILWATCSNVDFIGAQYGIYKADGIDVGFPRRDKGHGKGAEVEVDPRLSVEEAAKRRDLSINAMYLNPFTMEIIDPFNGRYSISNNVLRHVSDDTFHEDPLRPLRVARFSATLRFDIDHNTMRACRLASGTVGKLPKERVFGELCKVLLEATKPSMFFRALSRMHLLSVVFPDLFDMQGVAQGKAYHPEGSVYEHTLLALDAVPVADRELDVMLAIMMHDFGKASVPNSVDGDKIHFYGHAEELEKATSALSRLTNEIGLTESVLSLVKYHMRPYGLKKDSITKKMVRRLAASVDMRKLIALHRADRAGRGLPLDRFKSDNIASADTIMAIFEEIEGEIKPILTGRHLIDAGLKPGKHFGEILKELYEYQLDEQFSDVDGGLRLMGKLFPKRKEV